MLSSVDCHTQFLYKTAVFTDIKAFVMHLPSRALDCYELTSLGMESIRLCSLRFPEKVTSQHLECFKPSFYCSLKPLLINNHSAFTVIDARRSQPFSQSLSEFEKFSHGSDLSSVQQIGSSAGVKYPQNPLFCGSCGKIFPDIESKRKHQSRSKCKTYTSKAAKLSPVKVSEVHNFLKQPCKSIGNRAHYQKNHEQLRYISRERYASHVAAKKKELYREKLGQIMKTKYRDQLKKPLKEKKNTTNA